MVALQGGEVVAPPLAEDEDAPNGKKRSPPAGGLLSGSGPELRPPV
jgi:hypothetical protein